MMGLSGMAFFKHWEAWSTWVLSQVIVGRLGRLGWYVTTSRTLRLVSWVPGAKASILLMLEAQSICPWMNGGEYPWRVRYFSSAVLLHRLPKDLDA